MNKKNAKNHNKEKLKFDRRHDDQEKYYKLQSSKQAEDKDVLRLANTPKSELSLERIFKMYAPSNRTRIVSSSITGKYVAIGLSRYEPNNTELVEIFEKDRGIWSTYETHLTSVGFVSKESDSNLTWLCPAMVNIL